jgi:hypothetical protein
MSTVDAFNTTLKNFLQELVDVFPDEPGVGTVKLFLAGFDLFVGSDPRAAMDAFMKATAPHGDLIAAKDGSLFKHLELPGGISLKDLWKKASAKTKEATWQYLHMLHLLGTTAAAVPPDMLNAIEHMASEYATKVKSGEVDLAGVASMLFGGAGASGGNFLDMLPPPPPKK